MPPTVRDRRAAQVREDEALLAHIQSHLQRLQQERAAAHARLADAKRVADDLDRETCELQDVEQKMAEKLASSRAALVQECVSTLPEDILRCIFAEAVSDGAEHAPFAIAAVCGRWRRVALESASLWSIIYTTRSALGSDAHRTLSREQQRVAILLTRSRSAPLIFRSPIVLSPEAFDDETLRLVRRLFKLLGAHVSRWKVATLRLPRGIGSSSLDFLKGPTPLLEHLTITSTGPRGQDFSPSQSGYLPFAPRLRDLSIDYAGIGCSTTHGFPAMERLSLYSGACADDDLTNCLHLSSQSLQELVIWKSLARGLQPIIHLPRLKYLCITPYSAIIASTPTPSIVTPMLVHLSLTHIPAADVTDSFLPFLDAVSQSVRKLTIFESLSAASILVLAHLRNLEEIDFDNIASFTSDDALAVLTTHDPPVWPRLARLTHLSIRQDIISSEALLRFIASRTLPEEIEARGAARPCKLGEVTFNESTPRWLVAGVERLLRL